MSFLKSRIRLRKGIGEGMVSTVRRTAGRLQVWFYKPDTLLLNLAEADFSSSRCWFNFVSRKETFPSLYRICVEGRGIVVFN